MAQNPPDRPVVYEHDNYGGRSQTLDLGSYEENRLSVGNNAISSVRVPPGWKVTLYDLHGFAGASRELTHDTPSLPGFNDVASSVIVEQLPAIYASEQFTGHVQRLDVGRYDLVQLPFAAHGVRSAKVPPGWKITLYRHRYHHGSPRALTADEPVLDGDTVNSIAVDNVAVAYEHGDFGGKSQVLDAGRYDGDAGQLTLGHDRISSVRVPPGMKVTLYEHGAFAGRSKVLTENAAALPDFNDMTSGIVVETLPVVYQDNDYQGRSQTLDIGRHDTGKLIFGDDMISSLEVPSGWMVTLHDGPGFTGAARVITEDTPSLGAFNDRTSSITVEYAPVVFDRGGYRGAAQTLAPGRYDLARLTFDNDSISSVWVPPGWKVTLYEHDWFGGASKVLLGNAPSLGDFNNRASSLIVERVPSFYELADYGGRWQSFDAGHHDMHQLTFGNDSLSSLRVPPGWMVILYEHSFSGESLTVTSDMPALGRWDNRVSSLVVKKASF